MTLALTAARGRDCNGNGVEDTEDIARGTSQDCNGNNIPDACEGWPIRFTPGSEWPLGGRPVDVAAGDIDSDGDFDLIVGQQAGAQASVSLFLNQGNRGFEPGDDLTLEGDIMSVSLADLNGDGYLDVVAAAGDHLVILENQGDGSFSAPIRYASGDDTSFVHVADVNGDGAMDVLSVRRETESISLWINGDQGDGKLNEPVALGLAGSDPVAIATGDLDGDSRLDIVVANQASADVSILLNAGEGSFASPRTYPRGSTTIDPLSLSVADFNGDGLLDVGSTRSISNTFLFNQGEGILGEPVAVLSRSIFSALRSLAHADFDHDGDLDIAAASNREGVTIRQNDGDGGFAQAWELGFGTTTAVTVAGDFDGDGWADLALVGSEPETLAFVWNDGGNAGKSVGVEIEVLPLEGCSDDRGCRPHGGTLADLDGDGDLDGIGLMTHPGEFHFVQNETGIMVTRPEPYIFGRDGQANGEHGQWVAAGDLDGDGDADLVSVDNLSNDFWVHLNRGDGSFEPVGRDRRIDVGQAPQHVSLGDLDGDGDLDGVVSNLGDGSISLVMSNGDGSFDPNSIRIATGSGTRGTAIADFNGDGMNDIVVANSAARSLTLLINNGEGVFPQRGETVTLLGNPNGVTSADLDGDGDLDIVAAVGDRQNCAVLLNEGEGSFAEPVYYAIEEEGAYSVSAVDFNLDGALDLVTANETSGSVSILLGRGDGTFGQPTSYSAGPGAGNRMALAADLDGDGDPDIMTFNRGNFTATVFYNLTSLDTPDYAESICTVADFFDLAATTSSGGTEPQEFVKFILPASDEAMIQETVYQNSTRFRLHQEFLSGVFPEKFPALDAATYDSLIGRRDSRHYFAGAIRVIRTSKGAVYGFDVFARFGDSRERLTAAEVQSIHTQLQESFRLGPLLYAPNSLEAVEVAREWQKGDPGFPILIEGSTGGFEPYTQGVGYGRVRLLSARAFDEANASGGISFQDIIILERAPRDIEGVVNGIITAERQGELSHLAVRTARRGTPNAFVRTALEDFADLEGQLVRLQVNETGYAVRAVTEGEAAAFWEANAGFLSHLPSLDAEFSELPDLEAIAAMDGAGAGLPAEARFGGKATNLARLQSILTGEWSRYRINGFAVPMAYYLDFLRSNTISSAFRATEQVTYEVYLEELFASHEFATNSQFRFAALVVLREHMRKYGVVDESLVVELRDRIAQVMGTPPDVRVRFRSSSNAEDAIEFNGAGLYDSTQGCVADDLDGDTSGPSHCNDSKNGERDLSRALRRVWSSLWNFRAYEERRFYRIPDELAAMGILVTEAFDGELANGVATTGNASTRQDPRFVITVQKDDHSVVSPDPGILPEKNILEMDEDGQVTQIIRAVTSSLAEPGEFVLSDEELRELGALMWHIHSQFPVDPGVHSRDDFVLEIEFKKRQNSELAVKQVRPFLLTERGPAPPVFSLSIPDNSIFCAKFDAPNLSRTVMDEYELKGQLHLSSGIVELPTAFGEFTGQLVEKLVLGQAGRVATPADAGIFTLEKLPGDEPGLLIYRFEYTQQLEFPDGETVDVKWSLLDFATRDGVPVNSVLTLDEPYLVDEISLQTQFQHQGMTVTNFYGSCGHESLPLWKVAAELDDGSTLILEERFRDDAFGDFQPAALTGAVLLIHGQHRTITNYWDLIYKAARHNEHVEYLMILDSPVDVAILDRPIHAVHLIAPTHGAEDLPQGIYLDENFQAIEAIDVQTYTRSEIIERGGEDIRSDVTVAVTPLEFNGVTRNYLTISFESLSADNGLVATVESSPDLVTWNADAVKVSSGDEGEGSVRETWRSSASLRERPRQFLRVREE